MTISNYLVFVILGALLSSALCLAGRVNPEGVRAKARFSVVLLLSGFIVSYLVLYARAMTSEVSAPVTWILPAISRFGDFKNMRFWDTFQFHAGSPGPTYEIRHIYNYFPAAYLVFYPCIKHREAGLIAYVGILSIYFFLYSFFNLRPATRPQRIGYSLVFLFLSFPTMFTISTANFEGGLFILLSLFVLFYEKRHTLSSFCLGTAMAMKLYPAVFLVLLVSDKRYKQLLLTLT